MYSLNSLERCFVRTEVRASNWCGGSGVATAVVAVTTVGTGRSRYRCRCPSQRWPDVLNIKFNDIPLLTLFGLPGPLLEATRDDNSGAFGQRLSDVLSEITPARAAEEARVLLPYIRQPP